MVPGGVSRDGEFRVIPAILWLIERLARRHDVQVVVLRQEPRPASWPLLGATVHNIGTRPRRLGAVRTLLRLHRTQPFDVFQAIWAQGTGDATLTAARWCRRPVVVHLAGGELVWLPAAAFGAGRPLRRAVSTFVVRHADRVTAASSPMIALVQRAGGTAVRLPLGVDTAVWAPAPPRPRSRNRPARLVQVASLTPVKGQTTLLRAVAWLTGNGFDLHLDLVGEDALQGAVHRAAAELGLTDRVTFHGFLPQRLAVPIVRAADLMVVSSLHEAGPVALLEAAAVGVPTVGTAVGHLVDLAADAAVSVPIGDANALARGIAGLLEDDARRLAIAHQAQRIALREDADWTCARFEDLYAELTAPHGES